MGIAKDETIWGEENDCWIRNSIEKRKYNLR